MVDGVELGTLLAEDGLSYGIVQPGRHNPIGVPIIRVSDLESNVIDRSSPLRVSPEIEEKYSRTRLRGGEILVSIVGTIGRVVVVPTSFAGWNAARAIAVLRPRDLADSAWICYCLESPAAQRQMQLRKTDTVQATLNLRDLRRIEIPYPPTPERARIAGVLGALDDITNVNRALIRNLWSAVESAFTVAARGADLVPARDCIELRYGKALPAAFRRPGPVEVVSSAGIVGTHDEALVKGPGVVVGRKGSVGTVTWVDGDFYPIDTAFYVASQIPGLYCYFALRGMGLEHMNTDSAVPGLNRENALSRPFPRPTKESLHRFVTVTQPLIAATAALKRECEELAVARDELLPLLLTGRIRVEEVAA